MLIRTFQPWEKSLKDNIEKICSVYDSFLSEYPLCHGYWRKYAAHKAHLCTVDKVGEIFERAVQSATYCVGIWVEYCSFSMSAYEDPSDVRRLFKRAMSFVGKDYLCYPLWDKYIEFESSQQQWIFLAKIYVQTLKFPTKRLCHYYDKYTSLCFEYFTNVPAIHLFNARFKEQIGDRDGAHGAFLWSDNKFSSYFIEKVVKEANMEKRLGSFAAASNVYEKALEMAAEKQKLQSVPILYIHFARLKYMMTSSVDAARDVIIDGIQHVPHCKLLLEGLINLLMMHGGLGQVNVVDNIIVDAISPGSDASRSLGNKEREDISVLYLQFVDQCGTVHDIRKAWNRHIKLFPHLVRTSSLDKLPTSGNQLLDMFMEAKQRSPFPLSDQPSGGHNSDNRTELQMQELTDHFQPEDKDNSAQERLQQLSPKIAEQSAEDDASEVNKLTHDSVHQSGDDTSGHMESTPYLVHQSREDAYGPVESTHNLGHKSGEDANRPMESTHGLAHQPGEDASGPIVPTQECSDSINVQQQEQKQSHEPEQHLKLLSLDSLSLNSQEKEYGDSTLISSYKHQALISNRISENRRNANGSPSVVSRGSNRSADSAQIQKESVNPSSLASRQNLLPEQAQTQPHVPTDDAVNWHQSNSNTVQASGDARSGSYYQEGQQVIPLHGASSSGTAESPHPQQQSQGITPAHRADGSGTSVSPHRQQQSLHGATPPHSAGASGPTTSPCNHQ
ncbi:Pre-mRNA-processing factor 39 [Camellia lanceoleosa]|uniref:Pre-mRNA-processing factor 39 n=1 Tax=Camellia lanceoleosa TaxID=1840588 RepID=A0ACC0GM88_9ERIC|nr:Pre-mRNA-processing factor 39 [Camellia lanceoleosa]